MPKQLPDKYSINSQYQYITDYSKNMSVQFNCASTEFVYFYPPLVSGKTS